MNIAIITWAGPTSLGDLKLPLYAVDNPLDFYHKIPKQYDAVIIANNSIVFEDLSIKYKIAKKLEEYPIIQPFSKAYNPEKQESISYAKYRSSYKYLIPFRKVNINYGLIWAVKRDILTYELYEQLISAIKYQKCKINNLGYIDTTIKYKAINFSKNTASIHTHNPGNYITISQLMSDTLSLITKLPNIARVIGISRSGLGPAWFIACHKHVPLYTVSKSGITDCGKGIRLKSYKEGHTLLIDDTIYNGTQMKSMKKIVHKHFDNIITASIYCTPWTTNSVDYVEAILPPPHYLEWNIFNSNYLPSLAFDMDGIIVTNEQPKKPLHVPNSSKIGAIITARPESERELTSHQLKTIGVKYKKLIMWPKTIEERKSGVAEWKAKEYIKSKCELYIESEEGLAQEIAKLSNLPVLCPKAEKIFK